ncbi:9474_t:CDS:2, partial [Rhizophagus irregularis]
MDAEDNNAGSCHNSEDEIDASLPATPARRLNENEEVIEDVDNDESEANSDNNNKNEW